MYDIDPDHTPGITAALLTVIAALLALGLLRLLASNRQGVAQRLLRRYDATPLLARSAAWLMLLSGAIHLALVPDHAGILDLLFIVDGLGFIALAMAAVTTTWWRRLAALWLAATILAYLLWVVAGWEPPDQVGIACKLIELLALGCILRLRPTARRAWPRRFARATGYPAAIVLTTLGIWLGGLAHPDAQHSHAGAVLQPVANVASTQQRQAAARLLDETRISVARYADPAVAIADGFKPSFASDADPLLHWSNPANVHAVLDPAHPQDLVYVRTSHGLRLVGAMFQMPRIGQWGPDPGGPLTAWHQHEGICFSPLGVEFSFSTPFWTCPLGSTNVTTPPMLHVWIIDNGKNGPFSADLDAAVRGQLMKE